MEKIKIINCDDHAQEVIEYEGKIIFQGDCGTEILSRLSYVLGLDIEYETISGDEYEKRYA